MTIDPRTTGIVERWLVDGPIEMPERVLDAVIAELPERPQRGRPRLTIQGSRAWLAAAAAFILVITGLFVLADVPVVGPPATNGPSPGPTPTPTSEPTIKASDVLTGLIADWNAGDPTRVLGDYDPLAAQVRLVIDSDDIVARYGPTSPASLSTGVAELTGDGFSQVLTGSPVQQGPFVAVPATFTRDGTAGSSDAIVVVRLTESGAVTMHFLFGTTQPDPTADVGIAALTAILDAEIDAWNRHDGAAAAALFAPDAVERGTRTGEWEEAATAVGTAAIADLVNDPVNRREGWQITRIGPGVSQGSLGAWPVAYRSTAGQGDEGFYVIEVDADGLIRYQWLVARILND